MKHANQIQALEGLRREITMRLAVVDEMSSEARGNLVLLGPIAQLQHSLNDSLGSIRHVIQLLKSDAEAPKRKKRSK